MLTHRRKQITASPSLSTPTEGPPNPASEDAAIVRSGDMRPGAIRRASTVPSPGPQATTAAPSRSTATAARPPRLAQPQQRPERPVFAEVPANQGHTTARVELRPHHQRVTRRSARYWGDTRSHPPVTGSAAAPVSPQPRCGALLPGYSG